MDSIKAGFIWIKSFDVASEKHLSIAFNLIRLVFKYLVFLALVKLSPKMAMLNCVDDEASL